MGEKFKDIFGYYRKHFTADFILFILLILPPFGMGLYGYSKLNEDITNEIYADRRFAALTAATALTERLDRLVDISVFLAGITHVSEHIEVGEWADALGHVGFGSLGSGIIERVFLADPSGTLQADIPHIPEVLGQNFAARDWYKGVSKEWQPYISGVYKRQASPQYNVIAIAAPVRSAKDAVVGILVLQIKLDTLMQWIKEFTINSRGSAYFVDQMGHIVANPEYSSQDEIIDYSTVPVVQKVLSGESGVGIFFNPIKNAEIFSAFEPTLKYGWGVIVEQNADEVFATRDRDLKVILAAYILLATFFVIMFFYAIRLIDNLRKREEVIYNQKKELLHKQELEKFYQAVASAAEHIIITDSTGKILYANKAAEEITGYSLKEMLGQTPRLWGGLMPREFYEKMWKTIKEDKKSFRGEIQNKKKNGQLYFANTRVSPVLDERGEAQFFVGIERDITEEKILEKARVDLLTLASHQLRTPLSGTKWLIETLRRGVLGKITKKQAEYLEHIYDANERMIKLVYDMLNTLRIESRVGEVVKQRVFYPSIAKHINEMLDSAAKGKGVVLTIQSVGKEDFVLNTDEHILKNILECLVSNAINYSSSGGEVVLGVKKEGSSLVFSVKDSGIGIPKEEQPHIFERFYRASNAKIFKPDGTGLGLYLVKLLTEKIGAKITFESEVGKGSTFNVSVPQS